MESESETLSAGRIDASVGRAYQSATNAKSVGVRFHKKNLIQDTVGIHDSVQAVAAAHDDTIKGLSAGELHSHGAIAVDGVGSDCRVPAEGYSRRADVLTLYAADSVEDISTESKHISGQAEGGSRQATSE